MLADYERILVFAAHADDEMGMAPTICKFVEAGRKVSVVNTTNGSEGYPRIEMKDTIVEMRRKEAAEADKVLGITKRYHFDYDTQGALTLNKQCLQEFMRVIREVRPDVIFTHGPEDKHIDHIRTSELSMHAFWQAGQPVAVALGEPWKTKYIFYYKGVADRGSLPRVEIDVTDTWHKRHEAMATQESQFTLFHKTREDFLKEAQEIKEKQEKRVDAFWIPPRNVFGFFPPLPPEEDN